VQRPFEERRENDRNQKADSQPEIKRCHNFQRASRPTVPPRDTAVPKPVDWAPGCAEKVPRVWAASQQLFLGQRGASESRAALIHAGAAPAQRRPGVSMLHWRGPDRTSRKSSPPQTSGGIRTRLLQMVFHRCIVTHHI
jgi:hypothetical protein